MRNETMDLVSFTEARYAESMTELFAAMPDNFETYMDEKYHWDPDKPVNARQAGLMDAIKSPPKPDAASESPLDAEYVSALYQHAQTFLEVKIQACRGDIRPVEGKGHQPSGPGQQPVLDRRTRQRPGPPGGDRPSRAETGGLRGLRQGERTPHRQPHPASDTPLAGHIRLLRDLHRRVRVRLGLVFPLRGIGAHRGGERLDGGGDGGHADFRTDGLFAGDHGEGRGRQGQTGDGLSGHGPVACSSSCSDSACCRPGGPTRPARASVTSWTATARSRRSTCSSPRW